VLDNKYVSSQESMGYRKEEHCVSGRTKHVHFTLVEINLSRKQNPKPKLPRTKYFGFLYDLNILRFNDH
jgi:hypothetical protein